MDALWFEILGVLLLILLVGFFSASEVAVLSTRKSRMKELSDDGNRKAAIILAFRTTPERFLATIHVGIVFSMIFASGLGGLIAIQHIVPSLSASDIVWIREAAAWIALGIVVLVIGFLEVVFAELVPKSLALRVAEPVALAFAPALQLFAAIFRYPATLLTFASNLVLAPFKDETNFTESRISEEEFKLILDEGTKSGLMDKTEQELIKSIFAFTDTTAKEVMIPRPDVVALNIDLSREALLRIVLEEGYSRMPVYKETIDNIIGIVYTKDLLGLLQHGNVIILQDTIRPAFFVPETKKISQLMRELQQRKNHMAIVIDEFGGMEGIITMEDIIEEIVGEIHDEYDEEIRDVEEGGDGSFQVNARISIKDFNNRFGSDLPEADDYETLSGFLHKLAGRIPDLNEEIHHGQFTYLIVKKSQRRIRVVRVRKLAEPDPHPPQEKE
jgi:putative hemolysin